MTKHTHLTLREPGHTISIPKLRAALNGRVITPGGAAYDEARTVFYGSIDRHPALIVRAKDASDISRVVSLARESGLSSPSRAAATASPVTALLRVGSCSTSRR